MTDTKRHQTSAEAYRRAIALLRANSAEGGIIACASSHKAVGRNYASIFGRDAAICSLGMIVSGDRLLIENAEKSLVTLACYQAPNGQIPKYVKPELREADFWYCGCIDATLWWLLAVDFHSRHLPGRRLLTQLATKIELALQWLL